MDGATLLRLEDAFAAAADALTCQDAERSEHLLRGVLAEAPNARRAAEMLAEALLMQGRYREAWPYHEAREHRLTTNARALPFPEWDGSPLDGRSIVVWGEQGLGDEIQMARFVPKLRQLGASRVSFACHPLNVRVFEGLGYDVFARGGAQTIEVDRHDLWVLGGSLPFRLGVTLETLDGSAYIPRPPARRAGIGLVEQGNPKNPRDAERSLPAGLLEGAIPQGRLLRPTGDLRDSMAAAAGLDLLITVDTSWAHLAGALGVPCWVLLPHRSLDWRWLRSTSHTPWYRSMRLFRRGPDEDWRAVTERVAAAL